MAAKKPTLRDVSQATGLSIYTVSRALSDRDGVSRSSRELVLKAARELGYVPNRAAQELRRNTRSSVGVITASTSNHYYLDLMDGIQRTLRSSHRTAIVADVAAEGVYTREVEETLVRDLIQSRTAGVIATLTLSKKSLRLFEDWDIPVVFVDSLPPEGADTVPSLSTDNFGASMKVGAHLAEHGYGDWLFVAYPALWSSRAERERGLREAASAHGARLEVLECENDAASAFTALSRCLDEPGRSLPRVVIAGNNPLLHASLQVLRARDVTVPEDVAVVAFDEFAWAPLLDPPLTVLNEDSESIGVRAAQILTRIIDEQVKAEALGDQPTPVYLPADRQVMTADLIIRKSCGC
ncbi:LacI family DNA-binding transcriptional regulator [Streptomyces winkii]|uniref:LacI family DNA-binding transcriptional regulator n=1 Tax=Streptomyces winkii TaxID=3051178 RepID=UPI0028D67399|nr:LacI family DNA-binding transcriptional regulator [Streptomyces sp. DSM 40971]